MRRPLRLLLLGAVFGMVMTRGAFAGNVILVVGPGQIYPSVSSAVAKADSDTTAANYYTIEVIPGTYTNDFSTVTRPMTIEASEVGTAGRSQCHGVPAQPKGYYPQSF